MKGRSYLVNEKGEINPRADNVIDFKNDTLYTTTFGLSFQFDINGSILGDDVTQMIFHRMQNIEKKLSKDFGINKFQLKELLTDSSFIYTFSDNYSYNLEFGIADLHEDSIIANPIYFNYEILENWENRLKYSTDETYNDELYGIMDFSGNRITLQEYNEIRLVSENLAAARTGTRNWASWGFIDSIGNEVITVENFFVGDFANGLASVRRERWSKIGYINTNDELEIKTKYREANPFNGCGYAIVKKKVGKEICISKQGKKVNIDYCKLCDY